MTTLSVQSEASGSAEREHKSLLSMEIAVADYDRTRPILDGRVKPEGISLSAMARWIGDFCRNPVYEEYDAAEMSFSWYIAARGRGEPVIALPIFLLRMPVLAYVYVRADSRITNPNDLIGKRIGSRGYRQTVNLWLRGLFQEHYGLSLGQAAWVIAEEAEGAGYTIPSDVSVEIRRGSSAATNLKEGIVDAMVCTSTPEPFLKGEKWIRRLFPDVERETRELAYRTGITPITHVLVMNKRLADKRPWAAVSLYNAFVEAQRQCDETYLDPKRLSFFGSEFILESQQAAFGANPYTHGIARNRKVIDTFSRYAHEQGYITSRIPVDGLFVQQTLLS